MSDEALNLFRQTQRVQHGVVSRAQARAADLTTAQIRAKVHSGRWQRLHRGVYATFSGPVPRLAQLWAIVLVAGPESMLSHETAAELQGLLEEQAATIHVTTPQHRRLAPLKGVTRHLSSRVEAERHPTRLPPQTRVESTVLDLTQATSDPVQAAAWVTRACAQRLTTVDRLAAVALKRPKLKHRAVLLSALADTNAGCHSELERRYLDRVERRHRLPRGERQARRQRPGGFWYDDVRYEPYRTIVELDGIAAHPSEDTDRDRQRDNAAGANGYVVLRYTYADVEFRACETAAQIARVLATRGWSAAVEACGSRCRVS